MRVFGSVVLLVLIAGCVAPSGMQPQAFTTATQFAGCTELGPVAVEATCACSNKRTYDRLEREARSRLHAEAQSRYPSSDSLSVKAVDLYMNNAIATGTAYRCSAG